MTESARDVHLEYKVAKDLINTKQRLIRARVDNILQKWKQESAEEMIDKTRKGELEEAEHDAIVLTNLLKEMKELGKILKAIS